MEAIVAVASGGVVCAYAVSRGIKPADTAISPTRSFRIFATFVSDEMCSPCATPGERGVVWGFPADALVRRGRVCAWYRVRTPRSTCWLHRLPVPSCRPVHPLVRQEIGSAPSPVSPRLDCRRAVSAARRIHGQDSRRFTFYHRQVGLPCIAQGGQSSPGRESPACFYPILSWAVYRTRFLASEGLPACLPLPVFPGCHPSLRAVTLPVSRHWSGYAGLHLPADGVSSPDRFGRPAGRDLHPPVGGTRTHRRERGRSLQAQSPPPWAAG